ncbi:MAG: hypothetical protein IPG44_18115 [Anaerolineales bacterium]|jgi:hypothetical protein|nr:hypothetical protein [Anaerolineales bacterium]
MKRIYTLLLVLSLLLAANVQPARADAAPPEAPPGTTLLPGESVTEVRMVSETVILTISADPADKDGAIAKTDASFTMRNLGAETETMAVRFPLSFFNGNSDGYGGFPEIASINVKVDGKSVSARREVQPFTASEYSYPERDEIPWAVFDVTFLPNQDVTLEVSYTVDGYGYYPYEAFKYILETGAGWNGTIGSAEIIVRLPYEVSEQNLDLTGQSGYGESTSGGVRSGNEIRWTFTDLEPTYQDNIQIAVVVPSLWQAVLQEKENVEKNPNDGEAWGRLAKAYKEAAMMPKGYLRGDPGGQELNALSRDAYERCLALLPDDPLWHYGYADLLWAQYQYEIYFAGRQDTEGILTTLLSELQTTLALDPNNQLAKDLLLEIHYQIPQAVQQNDDGSFTLLGLTATPVPPTPWGGFATETALPSTPEPAAPPKFEFTPTPPIEVFGEEAPICGSAAIFPLLFGLVLIVKRKT